MTRNRILAAVALAAALVALLAWQHWRERLIRACAEEQGLWDGTTCKLDERRIRIQRDLHRA